MSSQAQEEVPLWTRGWRMQRALAHAGMTTDDMATELEVSRSTVSRWINDKGPVKRYVLRQWALRTGVPLSWLCDGSVPMGPPHDALTDQYEGGNQPHYTIEAA